MSKIRIIFMGLLVVGVFLLTRNNFFNFKNSAVGDMTSYITKPVSTVFSAAGWWLGDKAKFFFSIGELKHNNQELFDENVTLKAKVAKLVDIEKENITLREELSLAPREKYNLEAALVIGRGSNDYSETIHINKGSDDGIKEGMAVLVGEGVLIGKIIGVTSKVSKIQLITDKNFKVIAKLVENGGQGVVSGQYGTSATMKEIPQTVEINKGDTIITSELSGSFRKGLLIGYAQEIFNTADGLFQEVTVLLPRELENLHVVWVLLDSVKNITSEK